MIILLLLLHCLLDLLLLVLLLLFLLTTMLSFSSFAPSLTICEYDIYLAVAYMCSVGRHRA